MTAADRDDPDRRPSSCGANLRRRHRLGRRLHLSSRADRRLPDTRPRPRCSVPNFVWPEPRVKYAAGGDARGACARRCRRRPRRGTARTSPASRAPRRPSTLPRSGRIGVVPREARAHPVVHPDVEIGHHEHRRLETLGEIECLDGEVKHSPGIRREERDVLRVAVRQRTRSTAGRPAACASACRSTGRCAECRRRRRDLGVVREPDELAHQRDARARRRRERARARPSRADHHAGGRELVLGLDDAELLLAWSRVDAEALAVLLERFHERRGRRDRIPRADRRAGVHRAERAGRVAVDQDAVLRLVASIRSRWNGSGQS